MWWFVFCSVSRFSFTDTDGPQDSRGTIFLFQSTTSTRWRTFVHLFATLHVRWLYHIFNITACIYQTATRSDITTLSNYHLIDWWCEVNLCFFTWWFDSRFLLQQFDTGNRWTRSCTDYRKANRVIIDVHINLIKYNCKINPKMKTFKIITKNYFCAHHKNRTNILNCYFSKQTNNLAYQAKYPLIGNFYYFPKTVFIWFSLP